MIDERDLRTLLAEAADAAPPPGRAPEELLAAMRADAGRGTPVPAARIRANPRVLGLAAAVLVALLGLLRAIPGNQLPGPSLGSVERHDTVAEAEAQRQRLEETEGGTTGGGIEELDAGRAPRLGTTDAGVGAPTLGPISSDDVASGGGAAGAAGSGNLPLQPLPGAPENVPVQATDGAMVVKTGSLALEVEEGAYAGTVDRIRTTAIGLGGYVSESTTNRSDDALSGTISVRVPAAQFDDFLAGLRDLGTVEAEGVRGADVTAQHTDLEARLASVTATRERLQTLLGEATNVGDLIMIQDRITGVQTEIEQLQGQLRLLEDQVAMGTLSVSVAEPGADQVERTTTAEDESLGGAWDDARRRFGNGLEDVVAWSGTGAVLALFAVVVILAVRFGRRRLRRTLL